MRLRDKLSFMLGVIGCALIEFVVLCYPQHFPFCYACFALPLIALRLYIYKGLDWHLFLCDFCYFSNFCCLLQVGAGGNGSASAGVIAYADAKGAGVCSGGNWRLGGPSLSRQSTSLPARIAGGFPEFRSLDDHQLCSHDGSTHHCHHHLAEFPCLPLS